MYMILLLTIVCFAGGVISRSVNTQCKVSDLTCVKMLLNDVHKEIIVGIPELKIESSDPLFIKEIDGNLSDMKYKLFNVTLIGHKNCVISNLKINEGITNYDLNCQRLILNGEYEIDGYLSTLPIEGKGDFQSIAEKYLVQIESDLKKVKGTDGKTHLVIENKKLKAIPQDFVSYKFENLFNGQKDLADAVHKFAYDNWREVVELVQDPIWYGVANKVTDNMNKYLKNIPLEDQ